VSVNDYMDLFLEESREHLQILNKKLLELEQNPGDRDAINEIFRAVHTFKGMSATMDFGQITKLTHKMENLLDKLREETLSFSSDLGNFLFQCVDILEAMIENIASGANKEFNITDLLNKLAFYEQINGVNELQEKNKKTVDAIVDFNEYEQKLLNEAKKQNLNTYQITVEIASACVMKSVRAFMVFKNLEEIGEIIKSIPDAQDIEDEKFDDEFIVFFVTDKAQKDIEKVVNQISEVSLKEIKDVENLAACETKKSEGLEVQEESNNHKNNASTRISQTIRVDIGKLDKLMNLVGELVINKTCLEQIFRTNDFSSLNETKEQINRITTDLQNIVMSVRMVPIEQVFNRFPRMVRDLAKELGKEVNLIVEGKETELDRTVIDEIGDPLVHLIRNSIDHGIESPEEREKKGKSSQGTLRLIAKQEGNSVYIIAEDDGHGINIEKVKNKVLEKGIVTEQEIEQMDDNSIIELIFSPGFSTASKITDVSGRGVGLDVVKTKIQSLSGNVSIESKDGQGTKFTIKLPLTLAIIQALMVKVGEETYAVPLANIDETTSLEKENIKKVQGQEVMALRDSVLPLVRLAEVLEVPNVKTDLTKELHIVVVKNAEQQIGLVVNELIDQQEIVISSLGKLLNGIPGIAGAAILGDGTISLILDVGTLF